MKSTFTEDWDQVTESTTGKQKSKKLPTECKICDAPALYSYFGVIVCLSCKVFFKRNAEKKQDQFKCIYDGHCEVNINNRRICTSCRLAKCLTRGMQVQMIRVSGRIKKTTRQKPPTTTMSTILVMRNEKDQRQQLPTVNLLQADPSTLTIDQWNLLANLTHCYDDYSGFALVQRFIRQQNQLPPKLRFKIVSVVHLFTSLLSQGQLVYEKNADFISLSLHDRSILLRKTMKYVSGLGLCLIGCHTRIFHNPKLYKSAEMIFGAGTLATTQQTIDQLDLDTTFIKLILVLLVFSTSDYTYYRNSAQANLENIKAVLCIQDKYIELIWRYLLYKSGHEQAVRCFSNLIRCLFSLNDSLVNAVEYKQYSDLIDSFIKRSEETLALSD